MYDFKNDGGFIMNTDLLGRINNEMGSFSKGQRLIAEYLLRHYDKAAFMTASRLGGAVGVSESTVVRFATELGFDGYPQLQRVLQELIRNRLTSVQRMDVTVEQIGREDVLGKVLSLDIEKIRRTLEEISAEEFSRSVEAISAAKRIYILGVRSSATLAGFMGFYFNHIFDDVRVISTTSASEMFEQMIHIGHGDVFVGISFPRYSQRTVKAARYARSSGATVIAITDSPASPLAEYSDRLLIARSDMASFVDSLVAPLSLINAIIVAAGMQNRDEVAKTFDRLEYIWDEYNVYQKPFEQK